jgi:hypothetical protein
MVSAPTEKGKTMREKLIEILETVVSPKELLCDGEVLVSTARVADHLIANGVTFAEDNNVPSKWIPVTERLPEASETILVYSDGYVEPGILHDMNGKQEFWNILDGYASEEILGVTHWMPLPQAPKGE